VTSGVRLSVEPLEDRAVPTAGFPDPTFGTAGIVRTDVGMADSLERAWDLAVYPTSGTAEPQVVAVGTAATRVRGRFNDQDWALVRYNPDGSLDPSSGTVRTDVGAPDRLLADGKASPVAPFVAESTLQALPNAERRREGKAKA
jgi:hypothetical protein